LTCSDHYDFFEKEIDINKLTIIIKKLSRSIHIEDLKPNHDADPNFKKFAKTILRFPKLESFERNFQTFGDCADFQYFQKELEVYSRFASSLNQMKTINFGFSRLEQFDFQELMKKGHAYSGISGLIMNMDLDEMFESMYLDAPKGFDDEAHNARILVKDPNRTEGQEEELTIEQQMIEEIPPFFRFELFPNLKKLDILQEKVDCTLTSFVGDGFQALKNLQGLKICLDSRSRHTMQLFKQLSQLPLLQKFSPCLPFIKSEEWTLLEQFLKGQGNLRALSLHVTNRSSTRASYLNQNASLKKTIQSLAHQPLLKDL